MGKLIGGIVSIIIGLTFVICAVVSLCTHKDIPIYKYLVAKSSYLWKNKTNHFYLVVGIIIIAIGIALTVISALTL